jgi:poly(3-hydroxybutyrate) depolymerase
VSDGVRRWDIRYRAHNRRVRPAVVLLPARYGPRRPTPALPLVISPHGRNVRAAVNADNWRDLPARGGFALVCPGGQGRRLALASWGYRGQIADLARMPEIVRDALPWLRVDGRRIYAVGGSMGGQETLLLLGQYPRLLAGAVAFDSVTNFYLRYFQFARSPGGRRAQALARDEVGGTPRTNSRGYVLRSPTHWLPQIARSGVPLQIWWSETDRIVIEQERQSGAFYRELRKRRPRGRVEEVRGRWSHSFATYANLQLPRAAEWLRLGPADR